MNTCGTCEFWGDKGEAHRFRTCMKVQHDKNAYAIVDDESKFSYDESFSDMSEDEQTSFDRKREVND